MKSGPAFDMTTQPKALVLEPEGFSEKALDSLRNHYDVGFGPMCRDELLDRIGEFFVLFVRLAHTFDRPLLDRAKRLRVLVTPTTGLNHIDLAAAEGANILVLSLRGERAFLNKISATAELTWGLLLNLMRKILPGHLHVIGNGWDRDAFRGHELADKTLGVIGCGRLGTIVAGYGEAFGMRVVVTDVDPYAGSEYEKIELQQLCEIADVITVHVPSGEATRKLLGPAQFSVMKSNTVVINTSRGDVIDEQALYEGLQSASIAGAALDVMNDEYEKGPDAKWSAKLKRYAGDHDNLLLTPHIGGATFESMAKTEIFMVEKLFQSSVHISMKI